MQITPGRGSGGKEETGQERSQGKGAGASQVTRNKRGRELGRQECQKNGDKDPGDVALDSLLTVLNKEESNFFFFAKSGTSSRRF